MLDLCEAPHVIENVPISVSLLENNVTGVIGDRSNAIKFANGLILQLASLYSYDEVNLYLYSMKIIANKFDYVKWLPLYLER